MAAASSASATINDAENRIAGMMVGSAVADAAGIYTDGLTKTEVGTAYGRRRILASYKANELTPHYPDQHRAQYEDGSWSEVTEMALCSLFNRVHDFSSQELPQRLQRLSVDGNRAYGLLPLHLGQPTKDIVESANYTSNPKQVALQRWIDQDRGIRDRNGSNAPLARIHPVAAIAAQQNLHWSFSQAVVNCRFTHVDSRSNVAVMIAVALLRGLLRKEVQTQQHINPLIQRCKMHIDYWADHVADPGPGRRHAYFSVPGSHQLSLLLTAESLGDLLLDRAEDRGHAWKCLGAGAFCLRTAMVRLERLSGQRREDARGALFEELIGALVREGGAAQANAAFAGALLGAYLGYDAVPARWREGLGNRKFLMRKCRLLCAHVGVIPGGKERQDRDSRLQPARSASERKAMQGIIQSRRRLRLRLLEKRWGDPARSAERRRTVYGSLSFPALGK